MTMNMNDIERALRELRLSGVRATLDTRILQAQAAQHLSIGRRKLTQRDWISVPKCSSSGNAACPPVGCTQTFGKAVGCQSLGLEPVLIQKSFGFLQ